MFVVWGGASQKVLRGSLYSRVYGYCVPLCLPTIRLNNIVKPSQIYRACSHAHGQYLTGSYSSCVLLLVLALFYDIDSQVNPLFRSLLVVYYFLILHAIQSTLHTWLHGPCRTPFDTRRFEWGISRLIGYARPDSIYVGHYEKVDFSS